jgi:hypothetical protein
MILLISVSQVARITGMSHWGLAPCLNFDERERDREREREREREI